MSDQQNPASAPSAEAENATPSPVGDNVNAANQHLVNTNAEAAHPLNQPVAREPVFGDHGTVTAPTKEGGRDPEIPVNYENQHLLIGTAKEDIAGDAPTPMRNLNPEREKEELTGIAPNIAELNSLPGSPSVLRGTPAPEIDPGKKFVDISHQPRKSEIESGRGVGVITESEAQQSEVDAKAGAAADKVEFERQRQTAIDARLEDEKKRAAELTDESQANAEASKERVEDIKADAPKPDADEQPAQGPLKGKLPDSFPGHAALEAEGLTSYGKLRKFRKTHVLTEIGGIGPATAEAIDEAMGAAVDGDDDDDE